MTILAVRAFWNTSDLFFSVVQISEENVFWPHQYLKKFQVPRMFLCGGGMFVMREGIPVLTEVLTDSSQASSPLSVNI
jgi:hypothetical protein